MVQDELTSTVRSHMSYSMYVSLTYSVIQLPPYFFGLFLKRMLMSLAIRKTLSKSHLGEMIQKYMASTTGKSGKMIQSRGNKET